MPRCQCGGQRTSCQRVGVGSLLLLCGSSVRSGCQTQRQSLYQLSHFVAYYSCVCVCVHICLCVLAHMHAAHMPVCAYMSTCIQRPSRYQFSLTTWFQVIELKLSSLVESAIIQ